MLEETATKISSLELAWIKSVSPPHSLVQLLSLPEVSAATHLCISFMMDTSGLHLPLCFDPLTYVKDRGIPLLPKLKSMVIDMGDMTLDAIDVREAVGDAIYDMVVSRRNLSAAEVRNVAELEDFTFDSMNLAYIKMDDLDELLMLADMEPWSDDEIFAAFD
jgi:hypothetical protein